MTAASRMQGVGAIRKGHHAATIQMTYAAQDIVYDNTSMVLTIKSKLYRLRLKNGKDIPLYYYFGNS